MLRKGAAQYLLYQDHQKGMWMVIMEHKILEKQIVVYGERVLMDTHYRQRRIFDSKEFEDSEINQATEWFNKLTEKYEKIIKKQNKIDNIKDLNINNSGFLTIKKQNEEPILNCLIPSMFVQLLRQEVDQIMFNVDCEELAEQVGFVIKKGDQLQFCNLWYGDDPSYNFAGPTSSLGYYLYMFYCTEGAVVVNTKPLIVQCKRDTFQTRITRPIRRVF